MAEKRAHLIANSKSGKGLGTSLPEMAKRLASETGVTLTHYPTDDDFDAQIDRAVAAAKQDGGTVIAAGGDGTIRSVAEKCAETKVKMAAVACGTFNFFARTHKLPEDCEAAMRLALTGEARPVRLGRINDHYFLINASLGLYAKSIQEREERLARFGRARLVAIISTIVTFFTGHRHLTVQLASGTDRITLRTLSIFIGNNALQLRNLAMDVARCMKQNLLAVVILRPVSKLEMLRILWRGIAKTLEKEERLESFCVDSLSIKLPQSYITVALDGEMFRMQSPLQVESLPEALNLVLPAAEPAK